MNKKFIFSAIILLVLFFIGFNFKSGQQTEEGAVRLVVENFGQELKNVSLLSPTAAQDIEENYADYISSALLSEWKSDPTKALGRVTSSPWPARIEISEIKQFGSGAYDVTGYVIEITSVEELEGGIAARRPVSIGVVRFGENWLITGVAVGEYTDNSLAVQLRECLPMSDTESLERCQALLSTIRNFDDCVTAGFSILKSNPPKCQTPDGRTFTQETNSTWEQAMLAVGNCEVEKVCQTHSRIVTLRLKNGGELIATEPNIDDIINAVEAAEPRCGKIPMATE